MNQIRKYLDILKKDDFPIEAVYLFGSYAKGTYTKNSDIDLCIVSPILDNSLSSILDLAGKTVDIEDSIIELIGFSPEYFNTAFSGLVHEIRETGIKVS